MCEESMSSSFVGFENSSWSGAEYWRNSVPADFRA